MTILKTTVHSTLLLTMCTELTARDFLMMETSIELRKSTSNEEVKNEWLKRLEWTLETNFDG